MNKAPEANSVRRLKGVGPRVAERLARLGIHTIQDLLFHLPLRYQDRTRVTPLGALRAGGDAVIQGEVQLTEMKFGKRAMLLSRLSDGTGFITLRFYHFNAQQKATLARGVTLRCYGEVRSTAGQLEMVHPEYSVVDANSAAPTTEHLTPIYPTTEGLHQRSLRTLTTQALEVLQRDPTLLEELLPSEVLRHYKMPALLGAVKFVHRPPPDADQRALEEKRHPAQRRLVFEELLAQQLSLRRLREQTRRHHAPPLAASGTLERALLTRLPFALTAAQLRVIAQVRADLQQDHPMQRLVQGDVGSGKTLVAVCAALHAVEAGYQAAVMAPTEILAEQHHANFARWLYPLNIELEWLSGKAKSAHRRTALERIASGTAQVVVGTHALFQDEVYFTKLGLIVIDEQHRFGVHQRLALREKGVRDSLHPPHRDVREWPHQLIMTATPIPRTLAMTAYADLDCSVIDELPPGRTPVETVVIPETRRDEVVLRIRNACAQGRQAYWVCTLIEESELLQCQAAQDTAQKLTEALSDLRIGLIHGRMKPIEKDAIMAQFKAGAIHVLVATTVIEVGVDVPNASVIVIENAERLGLAQLHQLRGRVGRGAAASVCVLMYHAPLSQLARERLAVMRETNDGFEIARKDLEIRGPGEVLGTRQTGVMEMHIADLQRDQALIPDITDAATLLLERHTSCVEPLIARWVGAAAAYGEV